MNNELICTPVMLPTKDETSSLLLVAGEPKLRVNKHGTYASGEGWDYQHLYLVSDEEIKEGDWFLDVTSVVKCIRRDVNTTGSKNPIINSLYDASGAEWFSDDAIGKIIATTDKSLSLPLVSLSFIERWVNEQGKIDRVRLSTINGVLELKHEYRTCEDQTFAWNAEKGLVSKTPLRSEVIILPIEDKTFTKDDMSAAFFAGYSKRMDIEENSYLNAIAPGFDKWFGLNY